MKINSGNFYNFCGITKIIYEIHSKYKKYCYFYTRGVKQHIFVFNIGIICSLINYYKLFYKNMY